MKQEEAIENIEEILCEYEIGYKRHLALGGDEDELHEKRMKALQIAIDVLRRDC